MLAVGLAAHTYSDTITAPFNRLAAGLLRIRLHNIRHSYATAGRWHGTSKWWEGSHLPCGKELITGIVDRLDEADFDLLLLSPSLLRPTFIQKHELPRFAGPRADKRSLPVALSPLPAFGPERNLGGVERQLVFTRDAKSFAELSGAQRTSFANDLAAAIQRRALSLNGYRAL